MSKGVRYYFEERYPLRLEDLHQSVLVLVKATIGEPDEVFADGLSKLVNNFINNTKLHLVAYKNTMDTEDMQYAKHLSGDWIVNWLVERKKE